MRRINIQKPKTRVAVLYVVLQLLVILTMVGQFINKNFYDVFLCLLTLALFNIPRIADKRFNIELPSFMEVIILLFIYAAEIMGEIQSVYTIIPSWDSMLHTINGFMMAAIGFATIDILNRDPRVGLSLSPAFVIMLSFCFSMTIGVLWEFFEFGMDFFFHTDMQKDFFVNSISSVALNPSGLNKEIRISDITGTVINGVVNGTRQNVEIQGYLDIGIIDTMKDLIVNCIGAVGFSVFGAFYIKLRGKSAFMKKFIPKLKRKSDK